MTDKMERRSLETVLDDQHAAMIAVIPPEYQTTWPDPEKVPIRWANLKWTDDQNLYLRPTLSMGDPRYPELGRNSRKDVRGEYLIGIYTPGQSGLDLPDDLAEVLALAYPYGSELVTEAGTVEITGFAKRQGMPTPDGRYYTPVHISLMLWRSR